MAETTAKLSDDIRTLAEMGLSNARRQLEATGHVDVRIAVEIERRVRWLPVPKFVEEGMNSGPFKQVLFDTMREYVSKVGATAVIFVTDSWRGEPTEKQLQMGRENPEKLRALMEHKSFQEIIDEGYARRVEAVTVTVQTAETVLIVSHKYDRIESQRQIIWGKREENSFPQSEFSGRQKMYGVTNEV